MKFDKFLGKMREKDGGGSGGGVSSVNGFAPDDSGNVEIGFPATGYVANMHGQSEWCDLKAFLEYLSYGVYSINGEFYPDEYGNVNINAYNLLIREPEGEDDYPPTINDKFSTLEAYVMTIPDYYSIQSDYGANTDYIADTPGWLIIEWISHNITDNSAVTIDGQTFKLGNNYSNIGDIWQTYTFPLSAGSTWSIEDDEGRDYRICFLPCNPNHVLI